MSTYIGVIVTGAIGAPVRYLVDLGVQGRRGGPFPLGTLVVNVTGSLLLGDLAGLALYHAFPDTPKAILGAGFCGAYTTFSTHTFETIRLAEEGARGAALRNVAGNLVLSTAAAALGQAIAAL